MKIIIIGASGMLGHKMFQVLSSEFNNNVYGTIRRSKNELLNFDFMPRYHYIENADVENTEDILAAIDQVSPQVIINCAGVTLRKSDNSSLEKNYSINSYLPKVLSLWCENNKCKLIHFSTDCVFDGSKGNYVENDFPTATDVYGRSKYLGEVSHPNVLTLRLSIIGREIFNKSELLEWFLSQKNKKISGYSEVYYTGVTTHFLAHEVLRIIKEHPDLFGLYHIASEKISKFELLQLANQIFDNQTLIADDKSTKSDKSLCCDKYIQKTNFIKPSWTSMLLDLKNDPTGYTN